MQPHEKDTQDCLAIEEDMAALDCLKKVVAQYSSSDICQPKLVLLVQDNCLPCKEETALHATDIAKGIVQKININSPEGLTIAKENDIDLIPSLILLDCHNKLIMPV
ncbi:hypothetical protein KKF61_08450 [Patescibacteria group bacterium]|nr:hypothetical protein [Patescibacteria group bacterium]